jgi:hypothetical protein
VNFIGIKRFVFNYYIQAEVPIKDRRTMTRERFFLAAGLFAALILSTSARASGGLVQTLDAASAAQSAAVSANPPDGDGAKVRIDRLTDISAGASGTESRFVAVNAAIRPAYRSKSIPGQAVCKDYPTSKQQRPIESGWPTPGVPDAIVRTCSV